VPISAAVHEDIGGLQAKCKVLFTWKDCYRHKAMHDNAYSVVYVTYRHNPFHEGNSRVFSLVLLVSRSRKANDMVISMTDF